MAYSGARHGSPKKRGIHKVFDHGAFERRLQLGQDRIGQRGNLQKQQALDLNVRLHHACEKNIPSKNQIRCNRYIAKEMAIAAHVPMSEEYEPLSLVQMHEVHRNHIVCDERRLASELNKIKDEQLCKDKRRLQLRQNSLELRDLENKLKAAYFRKDGAAKLAEMERQKAQEKLERQQEVEEVRQELYKNDEEILAFEQEKLNKKLEYGNILIQQREEKELTKQQEYEDYLRERLVIDEIVRKIHEEDTRVMEERILKMKQYSQEEEEFIRLRDLWRRHQQEIEEEENKNILEYINRKEEQQQKLRDLKKMKEEQLEKIHQELSQKLLMEAIKKLEVEKVREEILLEEKDEAARNQEMIDAERKALLREQLRKMFDEQVAIKADFMRRQKEEEEAFRLQMLAKLADEDRIEQMNAEKRRRKQLEHRKAVEQMIIDRRANYVLQKELEMKELQDLEQMEKERLLMVEDERLRLLRQHVKDLIGYLPKGTFTNKEELDKLGLSHLLFDPAIKSSENDEMVQRMKEQQQQDSFGVCVDEGGRKFNP